MNEQDTRLTTWLAPLMGLLAIVVAGLVDFALYRLQLHVRSFFQPPAIVVLGAISLSALVVAAFLVAVAWVSLENISADGGGEQDAKPYLVVCIKALVQGHRFMLQ